MNITDRQKEELLMVEFPNYPPSLRPCTPFYWPYGFVAGAPPSGWYQLTKNSGLIYLGESILEAK